MKSLLVALFLGGAAVVAASYWRVGPAEIRVICPMTVGGSFDARTTALSGWVMTSADGSPAIDGRLTVDLRTLDTGIGLRNQHLRETYLEVDRGPEFGTATLSGIEMKGVGPDSAVGKGSFTGLLRLHGVTKTVTGAVDVRPAAAGLRVKASFPVTLSDYSIAKPRYLGIGVKDAVQVEVAFEVTR